MASSTDAAGISQEAILIYSWVVWGVVCQAINIFGIVTNIINIICFMKQGFKDSVNISLLGLSVSDLGSLITMAWSCICLSPAVMTANLPFNPISVAYLTSAMAHLSFTRVSSCITAMITIERCLCITAPLKINTIITPKRTAVITVFVFIIFFFSGSAVYAVNKLSIVFSPVRNKTLVGLVFMNNKENVEMVSFAINNFSIPVGAFAIIVTCTILLSFKLWNKIKWRKNTITHSQVDRVSTRNQKTAKMVVIISALFIVCFIPVSTIMLAIAFLPALSLKGKYVNLALMISGVSYIPESINSSMNIFIYYHMSSRYKETFVKIFYKDKIHRS